MALIDRHPDPEYSDEYRFPTNADAGLARLWVDGFGGVWLEAQDRSRVCVHPAARAEVAHLIRGAAKMKVGGK